MKISLSWVFDHINSSWKDHSVNALIKAFNQKTAEIEQVKQVQFDLQDVFLVRITEIKGSKIEVYCTELNKELSLPNRLDAVVGLHYVIRLKGKQPQWLTLSEWQMQKEGLVPAICVSEEQYLGGWKEFFEDEDYLLDIDNTSITHRPDLWGHRGIAREIAALIDKPMVPLGDLIASYPVENHESFASATEINPFTIEIKSAACKRFAGLYISSVVNKPSFLWMAHRLARVNSRPIGSLVDSTNYVMLDISQPMHAFDADKISSKKIVPRMAHLGEKIVLLDDRQIELTPENLVISDGKNPIALAGVMGGLHTAIDQNTHTMFLESASFDGASIRQSALLAKTRTEASTRFEKGLDPNQNIDALLRYLKILENENIPLIAQGAIDSVGSPVKPQHVVISKDKIDRALGVCIETSDVVTVLEKIGFAVQIQESDSTLFNVTVPTFRATKGEFLAEEVIEEIGRFYGYYKIPLVLPSIQLRYSDLQPVMRTRLLKQLCAYALGCREVNNYGLFDEPFLKQLQWSANDSVALINPISDHYKVLVTSLIPSLIKNVVENSADYDQLRFFEWGRIWQLYESTVLEQTSLAGIFYHKYEQLDFYELKRLLQPIFDALSLSVTWHAVDTKEPWWSLHQAAEIRVNNQAIGLVGKIEPSFLHKVVEGDACIFALNADFLLQVPISPITCKPLAKYPSTYFDVSVLAPFSLTVAHIERTIYAVDSRIYKVLLIDSFEKKEWTNQRSLTFRYYARDKEKTLTQQDLETINSHVLKTLENLGVTVR